MASRLKSEHNYCCWLQSVYRLIFVVSLHPLYCIVRNPMLRAKWFFGDIVDSVGVFVVKLLCLCSLVLTSSCVCNFDDLTLCAVLWLVLRVWFFRRVSCQSFRRPVKLHLLFQFLTGALLASSAQPLHGTRATRPLPLWRSYGPSVFCPLQLVHGVANPRIEDG